MKNEKKLEKRLEVLSLEEFNDLVTNKKIEMVGLSFEANPNDSRFSQESDCYVCGHAQIIGTQESPIVHRFLGTTGGIRKFPVIYGRYINKK